MKVRERVGADIPNRFDYQLALSMLYLIDSKEPITVIIETLEDFAIVKNINNKEIVDIYQVKTVGAGLISKSTLLSENVYGKLYLTDSFFSNNANTLNIISNNNLKGAATERLDKFKIFDKFSQKEKNQIYENIEKYFNDNKIFYNKKDINSGKLVFVKTSLPLKDTLFEKMLIGSVNELLNENRYDQSINPAVVFKTLKDYFIKVRNANIEEEITLEEAKAKRGINSNILNILLQNAKQAQTISKTELVSFCSQFLKADEILKVKNEYSNFIAKNSDICDNIFIQFKNKLENDFGNFIKQNENLNTVDAINLFVSQYSNSIYSKEFIIVCLVAQIYS